MYESVPDRAAGAYGAEILPRQLSAGDLRLSWDLSGAACRRIYINKSNVARQLAILEENGYVTRRPGEEDRRVMRVYPTEKAQAALPRIQEIMGNWEEAVAVGLTEAEREKLSALLEDMTRRASALLEE